VTDAKQVRDVVHQLLRPASRIVDCIAVHSTITPQLSVELSDYAGERGVLLVDAPVSGNLSARSSGRLAMFVGANSDEIEPYVDVFETLSTNLALAGKRGGGSALKMINNVLSLIQIMSVAEVSRMAKVYGISDESLQRAITSGSGDCYAVRNLQYFRDFPLGHPLGKTSAFYEFMTKDLLSALESASFDGLSLPFVAAAADIAPEVYRAFWQIDDANEVRTT
jgi:3-hydroxyisobutyrate dehydrogenase/2-hydroxy-3-oxopropionate reductase